MQSSLKLESTADSLFLSSKSLEMCTESLGSESGSGIDQLSDFPATAKINYRVKHQQPIKKGGRFPPPLTSISGLQVHTHREGGRLVIKAFAFQSSSSFFRAERGNGRLRLSLLRDDDGFSWGGPGKLCSRCNGATDKRMQTFQFCVVGV